MSAPIERHSQEVWRKTAEQLNGDGFSVGGDDSPGKDVNKNGAPLLGDSRDLFRPKTSDIPAQPGVYKWRDGEGRVIYVGKAKKPAQPFDQLFPTVVSAASPHSNHGIDGPQPGMDGRWYRT